MSLGTDLSNGVLGGGYQGLARGGTRPQAGGRAVRGPFGRPRWMGGRKNFSRMKRLRRIFPLHVCLFLGRLPLFIAVKMQ